jgi:large subunit ribosomal protein L9
MKLILKEDVKKIGKKGDVVDVPGGHATNFLIPRKLAVVATASELAKLKNQENINAAKEANIKASEKNKFNMVAGKSYVIKTNSNSEGKLFATVDEKVLAKETGLEAKNILLSEGIKNTGDYKIKIEVGENKGDFDLKITS